MRLLISGGRHFSDVTVIRTELDRIHSASPVSVLIHGGLPAIGTEAENWARKHDVNVIRYPANWSLLGKHAEARRNAFMLEDGRPDAILIFPGGRQTACFEHTVRKLAIPMIVLAQPDKDAVSDHGAKHFGAALPQSPEPMHH